MNIPEPTRPGLSGYVEHGKLLPWSWVDTRMESSRNYWLTTKSRGFPSSRPVWGVWENTRLLFSSGSQIGKNIGTDPRVQVNLESGDELVIIEGVARPLNEDNLQLWLKTYNKKYNWDMPETSEGVYEVTPQRVLAWVCDSSGQDAGVLFSNTATEWRFD